MHLGSQCRFSSFLLLSSVLPSAVVMEWEPNGNLEVKRTMLFLSFHVRLQPSTGPSRVCSTDSRNRQGAMLCESLLQSSQKLM